MNKSMKRFDQYMSKDEITKRINGVNESVNRKIEDKASVKFVSKNVKKVEERADFIENLFKKQK